MTVKIVSREDSSADGGKIVLRVPHMTQTTSQSVLSQMPSPAIEDARAAAAARQAELAKRLADAEAKGYADGLQKAALDQKALMSAKLKRFDEVTAGLEKLKDDFRAAMEDAVVELTLMGVMKVIGDMVWTPDQMRDYVQRAIKKAGYLPSTMTVKLSPADYELLSSELQNAPREASPQINWEPDSRIAAGGCIVESPKGHLDLRIETRLERLKDSLLETRRRPS